MKIWAAAGVVAAGMFACHGAGRAKVMVCLDPDGKAAVIDGARAMATRVLQGAGVAIEWKINERPCLTGGGIVVTVATGLPASEHPGALGYALPYEGSHIVLLYDRVLAVVPGASVPSVMGYVLAHEIGHMLQEVSRHSDAGVMKAHWDARDYADMAVGRLRFTAEDVELMRETLARGRRGGTSAAAPEA